MKKIPIPQSLIWRIAESGWISTKSGRCLNPEYYQPMNDEDCSALQRLEAMIECNLDAFLTVGDALMQIHGHLLHEQPSLEAYLFDRWSASVKAHYKALLAKDMHRTTKQCGLAKSRSAAENRNKSALNQPPEQLELFYETL